MIDSLSIAVHAFVSRVSMSFSVMRHCFLGRWTCLPVSESFRLVLKYRLYHMYSVLNKSWRQHPTKHQLYSHLPPITKTIQVRRTRHAGRCWRSRDELISDVLLWTPTYGWEKAGRPARTYIQQLCEDTGCSSEDLPEAMNDREKWRERVRDIRASGTTWWWYHIWDERPYASSWVFLFSAPVVEILPSSTLRLVLSILRGGKPRFLSLWWDFCYIVWFRWVFSFSWGILFK